ncbi:T9SS type A sorting domain-containing protein [Aureisphaera galaxeae]|uniref:T9SS type A sorting domain-containing protein n=1 Tax=Aureisphaera galaxeae TaxID=1538023 RepID=UPI0023503C17|nr:T9SS type A sorting domain-containing protein [Aureisphaera galaxeae]MDC8002790.1 T9SS type A sorting domain-containing protein [Aureisphaera galaxeae]
MKLKLLSLLFLFSGTVGWSQIVDIPDAAFKSACVNLPIVDFDGDGVPEADVDTNDDGEIQVSEAEAVQNFYPRGIGILSMEGIEAFSNLIRINCSQNSLSTLDFSQNVLLEEVSCFFNVLTSLDVTGLPNLRTLSCDFNDLTSLDVSQNPNLERLDFPFNQFTSIDISQNPALVALDGDSNGLTTIDFSQNPALEVLSIESNQLTTIDFSNNPLLRVVDLHDNNFTQLDLSANTNLDKLWCYENDLVSLDIRNGNNMAISILNALDNPTLECIQVDDVVFAGNQSNWSIDDSAFYSENCVLSVSSVSEVSVSIYPNPTTSSLFITVAGTEQITDLQIHDVLGRQVYRSAVPTEEVNVSNLKSGLFFLTVTSETGKTTKQFMKR